MEETLKTLIEITIKIEKIYNVLSDAEFNNNISLYNEYSNYLKLLMAVIFTLAIVFSKMSVKKGGAKC